jgi:hypothetical protein
MVDRSARVGAVVLIAVAAACLLAAPALMPEGYDPLRHTTSESAAQGLEGAWLARLGFLAFGFAVLVIASASRWWSPAARLAHALFGVSMVATASFASRSWDPSVPFVRSEDLLHSVAATAMGFAFAAGVAAVALRRHRAGRAVGGDALAIAASILLPLAMAAFGDWRGLAQRVMFAVAFAWYAARALEPAPGRGLTDRGGPSSWRPE